MTLSVYDTPEYRRSRSGYRWFCMLETKYSSMQNHR